MSTVASPVPHCSTWRFPIRMNALYQRFHIPYCSAEAKNIRRVKARSDTHRRRRTIERVLRRLYVSFSNKEYTNFHSDIFPPSRKCTFLYIFKLLASISSSNTVSFCALYCTLILFLPTLQTSRHYKRTRKAKWPIPLNTT
jgi:hypothetical protein